MAITTFEALYHRVKTLPPVSIVIAAAEYASVLESAALAEQQGLVNRVILTGNARTIRELLSRHAIRIENLEIRETAGHPEAAQAAVAAIRQGQADILVKGLLDTVYYFKSILDKETGIRASRYLSSVTLFEMPSYHKLLGITDNAIIPFPNLDQKAAIITNTAPLFLALDIPTPKVAIVAGIEKINPDLPSTTDAACLVRMNQIGQLTGFIIEGPFGYDAAIDKTAAETKLVAHSQVAGDPDLLLLPNMEVANILGKAYKFHARAKSGGVVLGAQVPVVLNSRSDSSERRLNALLLAIACRRAPA